jgi:hypothetical protein
MCVHSDRHQQPAAKLGIATLLQSSLWIVKESSIRCFSAQMSLSLEPTSTSSRQETATECEMQIQRRHDKATSLNYPFRDAAPQLERQRPQ